MKFDVRFAHSYGLLNSRLFLEGKFSGRNLGDFADFAVRRPLYQLFVEVGTQEIKFTMWLLEYARIEDSRSDL